MVNAISRTQQLPQLLKNSKTILRNYGSRFTQDHSSLKPNTLIWAMLALVIARVVIAQSSAQHAKGTPDAAFRHREAIQTTFREPAAWVLTYYVLRAIQFVSKFALRGIFGIEEDPKGLLRVYQELKEQAAALWKRTELPEIQKFEGALTGAPSKFEVKPQSFGSRHLQEFVELLTRSKGKAAVQKFYNYAPLLLGSVTAIFLSGYVLERFSLKYAPKLVQNLSNWFRNHSHPTASSPSSEGIRFNAGASKNSDEPRYSPFEVIPVQLKGFMPTPSGTRFPPT